MIRSRWGVVLGLAIACLSGLLFLISPEIILTKGVLLECIVAFYFLMSSIWFLAKRKESLDAYSIGGQLFIAALVSTVLTGLYFFVAKFPGMMGGIMEAFLYVIVFGLFLIVSLVWAIIDLIRHKWLYPRNMLKIDLILLAMVAIPLLFGIILTSSLTKSCENYFKSDTKDFCISSNAQDRNNIALCSKIDNPEIKDGCYHYTSVLNKRSDGCPHIVDNAIREDCMSTTAETVYACDDLTNRERRMSCTWKFAIDENTCRAITVTDLREDCLAQITNETATCNSLTLAFSKDRCFFNLGTKKADHTFCTNIGETHLKETCYLLIADKLGDKSICEFISEEGGYKMQCIDRAEWTRMINESN